MFLSVDYFLSIGNRYITETRKWGKNYTYEKFFQEYSPKFFKYVPINVFSAGYCTVSKYQNKQQTLVLVTYKILQTNIFYISNDFIIFS